MWVVYTECITDKSIDRYFYGVYESRDKANEVAIGLGDIPEENIYRCVCTEAEWWEN